MQGNIFANGIYKGFPLYLNFAWGGGRKLINHLFRLEQRLSLELIPNIQDSPLPAQQVFCFEV